MKSFAKWATSIILLLVAILTYVNSNAFISNQSWKYRNGVHIGDLLEFDSDYRKLDGRSIQKDGQDVAEVYLCLGKMLIIKSKQRGERSYYINK